MKRIVPVALFLLSFSAVFSQSLKIGALSCEYIENPLGIDILNPALSWTLVAEKNNQYQSAYEIIVSDNLQKISRNEGTAWNTGKVSSGQSINLIYKGKPLTSFTRYYWKVRVYDKEGKASGWSTANWFETAMLSANDWKAKWVNDGVAVPKKDEDFYKEDPMPVIKKVLPVKKQITTARLYVAAAGYYEAYINGEKISEDVLAPGWTNFSKRVLYRTYDITNYLKQGENIAGFMLGNGWYNPLPLRMWGVYNLRDVLPTGRPVVKAQLLVIYKDGSRETIATDDSWKTVTGPVLKNSVYLGELFDARNDKSDWLKTPESIPGEKKVTVIAGPGGRLVADLQEPVQVTKIISPVAIKKIGSGKFLVDMGENFAGVLRIRLKAPAGRRIVFKYGEDIYKEGSVNGMTAVAGQIKRGNGGPGAPKIAWQEDTYIAKGSGIEEWNPRFTFHVFRYIEITGLETTPSKNEIEGLRMNSDVATAGNFECSNAMFNQLQENILRTFKSNIFSVQSDCAGREKFGYGGDLFCTTESFCYNFNMHNFYRKALQDFEDDQRSLGGITETAPFVGLYDKGPGEKSGPLGWQLGFPYLVKKLYEFYDDKRVIEKHYPALMKQISFLIDSAKENLYDHDISDHESLDPKPEAFTASLFYYQHLQLMKEFSELLHKQDAVIKFAKLSDRVKESILKKFYKGNGSFDNETQAAQVFGLWYNLVSGVDHETALQQLRKAFAKKKDHLSTGIFATKMMFDVLRNNDRSELAYTVANQKDFPGWGYMIQRGATTIWETWNYSDNTYSQNHPMFGSVTEWFYRALLGINATSAGFKTFIIKPQPVNDLTYARGSFKTVYGTIGSDWKKEGNKFQLIVEVPVNTTAEVWLAGKSAALFNKTDPQDILLVKKENNYSIYRVGSGKYHFTSTLSKK